MRDGTGSLGLLTKLFPNIIAAVGYAPAFWLLFFAPQVMSTAIA